MRIGILTLPFNNNYGGYLQAYALLQVLRDMGHIPTLIMRRAGNPNVSLMFKIKFAIKGLLKSIFYRKHYPIAYNVESYFYTRGKNMHSFMNKYMQPQTPFLYSTEELKKECKDKFDAYIVGSDQIWRPDYVPEIENFFLSFTEGWNVLRIAYAASFGTDNPQYTKQQRDTCGKLISSFKKVSVRENTGIDIMKKWKWRVEEISTVLDPTLLLCTDSYKSILSPIISASHAKVLCYILDRSMEKTNIINRICSLLSRQRFDIFDENKYNEYDYILPSIETWLSGIRDADFIVTDSFHGTVFSIIFNKPFIVCINKERGADRFLSLLQNLNLEDRIINKIENIEGIIKKEIDWNIVNKTISLLRVESMNYLKEALNLTRS